MPYNEELLQQLSAAHALSSDTISTIISSAQQQGGGIEAYLLQNNLANDDDIAKAKSAVLGLPLYELTDDELVSPDILELIPENTAQQYAIIALKKEGDELSVGMVHPESLEAESALDFIAKTNGLHIKKFVISIKKTG